MSPHEIPTSQPQKNARAAPGSPPACLAVDRIRDAQQPAALPYQVEARAVRQLRRALRRHGLACWGIKECGGCDAHPPGEQENRS